MFDKNVFKEEFRLWTEKFLLANSAEVESFCEQHIPAEFKIQYAWLIEQSISWFMWKQENLQRELMVKIDTEFLC